MLSSDLRFYNDNVLGVAWKTIASLGWVSLLGFANFVFSRSLENSLSCWDCTVDVSA